jgi:hypothetical protein
VRVVEDNQIMPILTKSGNLEGRVVVSDPKVSVLYNAVPCLHPIAFFRTVH